MRSNEEPEDIDRELEEIKKAKALKKLATQQPPGAAGKNSRPNSSNKKKKSKKNGMKVRRSLGKMNFQSSENVDRKIQDQANHSSLKSTSTTLHSFSSVLV